MEVVILTRDEFHPITIFNISRWDSLFRCTCLNLLVTLRLFFPRLFSTFSTFRDPSPEKITFYWFFRLFAPFATAFFFLQLFDFFFYGFYTRSYPVHDLYRTYSTHLVLQRLLALRWILLSKDFKCIRFNLGGGGSSDVSERVSFFGFRF